MDSYCLMVTVTVWDDSDEVLEITDSGDGCITL